LPLAAQDRSHSRPSGSGDHGGGGRTAHGSSGPSAPSYSPPPSSGSSSGSSSSRDSSGWRRSDSGDSNGSRGSNASKPPRTAVPVEPGTRDGGGPNRQPPNRRNDSGGHGHGHHGGHGSFGGYYYPGYGYYPYGSSWWNVFYGYPYYGPDWQYPRYGTGGYDRDGEFGAIDLDVSPSRTQVFLDGQYIGTVDDFDGWPRYLWLEKGAYDLVLYLDGYKTDARQISVYPGLVIGIDDQMERGESIRPEDLATKTHVRRDARRRYESDRNEELDRHHEGGADDQEDNWKSRVRRHRVIVEDDDDDDADEADGRDSEQTEELEPMESGGGSTVQVSVEPDDASVYLDGKFIGTGADLARMASGLPVEPGDHKLSVVRPGRKDETVSFKVKPGQRVELEVQLEEKGGD
jgi:hypothetical protein